MVRRLDLPALPRGFEVICHAGAAGFRIDNVLEHQPGRVDFAIPESKPGAQLSVIEKGFEFVNLRLAEGAMMADRMAVRQEDRRARDRRDRTSDRTRCSRG